jgi:hypothetical protein
MQENRLASVLVVAPATEQVPTPSTEDELWTAPTAMHVTTSSAAWHKPTESLVPVSTSSDAEYQPYFIPALQVAADASATTDVPAEFFGGTTTERPQDSAVSDGVHAGPLSTEAADEAALASTTESRLQETAEGDVGLAPHEGNPHDVRGANEQGGSNADEKLLEADEDGALAEGHISESAAIQGNVSDSNSEDESRNADDHLQVDSNGSAQRQSASADGGSNPYLLSTESPDYGGSEAVALDYTSDVANTEATETPTTGGTDASPSRLRYSALPYRIFFSVLQFPVCMQQLRDISDSFKSSSPYLHIRALFNKCQNGAWLSHFTHVYYIFSGIEYIFC